ncbi:MAG: trypsin-like peptidase domain-containing protein [Roseburia sp.]|nr:trypsin-like peptidase domain-containing protein [Roseburia sp.]
MSGKSFTGNLAKSAAFALVFGIVGGIAFQGTSYFMEGKLSAGQVLGTETPIESVNIQPASTYGNVVTADISDVVGEVMPSIVAITSLTQQEVLSFFGGRTIESESSGSGIIISKDEKNLYIATNNHVVEKAKTLTVQFSDDSTAEATVRGTASSNDLAVVAVSLEDLSEDTLNTIKTAAIGDSTSLSVGEAAIAIGNALGYGQSVTTGVISALEREVSIQDETSGQTVTNRLIQTDAAINPGNSGGALINAKGEVIGINSSKYSDTAVEGMGFAIPMATAKPILEDLIANGKTTTTGTPYLGIYGVDVTDEVSESYNIPKGVSVAQVVKGSGAEQAGIKAGNIITAINGEEVSSMEELKSKISGYKVGDTVTITVLTANNGSYDEAKIDVELSSQQTGEEESDEQENNDDQSQMPFGGQEMPDNGQSFFPWGNW